MVVVLWFLYHAQEIISDFLSRETKRAKTKKNALMTEIDTDMKKSILSQVEGEKVRNKKSRGRIKNIQFYYSKYLPKLRNPNSDQEKKLIRFII